MRRNLYGVLLLATIAHCFPDSSVAQDREAQRVPTVRASSFPDQTARGRVLGQAAPELRVSSPHAYQPRQDHSVAPGAAPPSWHLPVAGAALGFVGGVLYIAARNEGQTIAGPAGVLLPIPVGALLGYVAGVAADEILHRHRRP